MGGKFLFEVYAGCLFSQHFFGFFFLSGWRHFQQPSFTPSCKGNCEVRYSIEIDVGGITVFFLKVKNIEL